MLSARLVDMYIMATTSSTTTRQHLDELAEDLTRRLGVPFRPNSKGGISFREPLRITSWSVPLVFDGHAAWDHGSLVPTDFVGHVLWAALRSTAGRDDPRPYWHCNLSVHGATAILEHVSEGDTSEGWVIGEDVLLEPAVVVAPEPPAPKSFRRRGHKVA